jgi:uncharacterized protein YyaL (SSP411 family)
MLAKRAKRIRPHLDDKILASWNGLMLGAFARASAVLGDEKYRAAAEKNLAFIQEKLWQRHKEASRLSSARRSGKVTRPTGTLFHRWRDGERDNVQLLEGYAFLLSGVIELYEATLEPKHLDFAIELAEAMIAKFYDAENGGFWQSAAGAKDLILRVKDDYDGAEPSGNSVATLALLKLAAITGREGFHRAAEKTLRLFAHRLQIFRRRCRSCCTRWIFRWKNRAASSSPAIQIQNNFKELLRAAHSVYQPNKIVLGNTGAVEEFARSLAGEK